MGIIALGRFRENENTKKPGRKLYPMENSLGGPNFEDRWLLKQLKLDGLWTASTTVILNIEAYLRTLGQLWDA